MQTRPVIKLSLSPLDKKMEWAGAILLVLLWLFTGWSYFQLPAIIPVHFNGAGKADSYGSKMTLFIMPVLGTLIYLGITQLNKYPHIFNYMTAITEENAHRQYSIATRMLRFLKLAIVIIFSLIIVFVYLSATGASDGPGPWFLPLILVIILLPTIIGIGHSLKDPGKKEKN